MKEILIKDAIDKDYIFIDVRSPAEYEKDHVPEAINLPVLDNEERKEIGIAYKTNQKDALSRGIKFYEKKLPKLTKFIKSLEKKKIVVYCWRGGLRSKIFTELVESLDYDAYRLKGGYKKYRAYVRKELGKIKKKFIVLYGLAGAGKTEIIQRIHNAVDLEGTAQHRGSVFGAIGRNPRTQKMFDSLLLKRLKQVDDYVFVEGESRKIGNIMIPENIYNLIKKNSINILIKRNLKDRAEQIKNDYFVDTDKEELKEIIISLKKNIGKKFMNELLGLLEKKEFYNLAYDILSRYYDDLYQHTFKQVDFDYEVDNEDLDKCIEELELLRDKLK